MFKKSILSTLMAAASLSALAVDYYVVAPLPGKQQLIDSISVALGNTPLPTGVVGVPYAGFNLSSALQVSGDPAFNPTNVGWSVVAGALPAGLTMNKGVITGTPSAAGAQAFTVRAAYKTKTGEQAYQVVTYAIAVSLTGGALPVGTLAQAYRYDLKTKLAVAGDATYSNGLGVTWSLASGVLPPGLSLGMDGVIAGTPTTVSTQTFTAQAVYKSKVGQQSYSIAVPAHHLVQAGGHRTWSDGTLAATCKAYLQGATNYVYAGATGDGVYRIDVDGAGGLAASDVVCDMTTDGGGWTVVQKRVNGAVDFYRTYAEYAAGFGTAATEYWLGNDRIAAMTAAGSHSMRFDLSRSNGQTAYETYSSFKVNGAADGYRLTAAGPEGTAGDSFTYQSGQAFTTKDVDQDALYFESSEHQPAGVTTSNCARIYSGAWWHAQCHKSNLNATYLNGPHGTFANGMEWLTWTGYYESLTATEMKVREN